MLKIAINQMSEVIKRLRYGMKGVGEGVGVGEWFGVGGVTTA